MKKFLSKFFLGVFALSMIAMASCGGDDKEDEEGEEDGGDEEAAIVYVIQDIA